MVYRDPQLLNITTTDASYMPVTFLEPVYGFSIRERTGAVDCLLKLHVGDSVYATVLKGTTQFFPVMGKTTVAYIARPAAENITVEVLGY